MRVHRVAVNDLTAGATVRRAGGGNHTSRLWSPAASRKPRRGETENIESRQERRLGDPRILLQLHSSRVLGGTATPGGRRMRSTLAASGDSATASAREDSPVRTTGSESGSDCRAIRTRDREVDRAGWEMTEARQDPRRMGARLRLGGARRTGYGTGRLGRRRRSGAGYRKGPARTKTATEETRRARAEKKSRKSE